MSLYLYLVRQDLEHLDPRGTHLRTAVVVARDDRQAVRFVRAELRERTLRGDRPVDLEPNCCVAHQLGEANEDLLPAPYGASYPYQCPVLALDIAEGER